MGGGKGGSDFDLAPHRAEHRRSRRRHRRSLSLQSDDDGPMRRRILDAPLPESGRGGPPLILVGVGRWGSTHPWLGIPVQWEDISGARVIVEPGFRDARVTPSQGSHFFQNLASLSVGFFAVDLRAGEGFLDWDWLAEQPTVEERDGARLLRFAAPVVVTMNGKGCRGVVGKPAGGGGEG